MTPATIENLVGATSVRNVLSSEIAPICKRYTRLFLLWIVLQTGGCGGAIAERQYYAAIMSSVVHLDRDNCREVRLARGKSSLVQKPANSLIATTGVKQGRFSLTASDRNLL